MEVFVNPKLLARRQNSINTVMLSCVQAFQNVFVVHRGIY